MEVFTATMNNFSTAVEASAKAQESAGSAEKENQKYQDSLQGSLAALKTAWEDFSRSMVDSGMITGVLKTLTKTLEFLSSDFGQATIRAVALGTAIHGATKLVVALGTKFTKLGTIINKVSKLMGLVKTAQAAKSVTQFASATKGASQAAKSLGAKGAKSFTAMGTAATAAATETTAVGTSMVSLSSIGAGLAAVLTNPFTLAVGSAVGLLAVVKKITDHEGKLASGTSKLDSLKETWDNAKSKAEEYKQKAEEASKAGKANKKIEKLADYWQDVADNAEAAYKAQEANNHLEFIKMATDTDGLTEGSKNQGDVAANTLESQMGRASKATKDYLKTKTELAKVEKEAGADSEEYIKAQKKMTKAYKYMLEVEGDVSDAFSDVKDYYNYFEKYGTEGIPGGDATKKRIEQLVKSGKSWKQAYKEVYKSWKTLGDGLANGEGILTKTGKVTKSAQESFVTLGKTIGVTANEAGKIEKVDAGKFAEELESVGGSAEDALSYLQGIKKTNPDATITLHGDKVAISKLGVIDGELQVVDQGADADVGADTSSGQSKVSAFQTFINGLKGTTPVGADTSKGESKVKAFSNSISALNPVVNVAVSITRTVKEVVDTITGGSSGGSSKKSSKKGKKGGAHGARNFPHYAGGVTNAQVNEYGFEIIESPNGSMRIANGGARGDTYIEEGSAVYTHGQSMRMLQKVGMTEADLLRGRRDKNKDVPIKRIKPLEGFAKGLSKKQYSKKVSKLREQYEDELTKIDDKAAIHNWSEAKRLSMIKKTYKKYKKKFKALAKKRAKGVSSKSFSLSELADYQDTLDDSAIDKLEERIDGMVGTLADLQAVQKLIKKSKNLTADEKKDLLKNAYARRIEYLQELLDEDEISVDEYLYKIEVYYKKGMITAKEYYDYVKEANEKAVDDMLEEWNRAVDRGNMTLEEFRKKIQELYKQGKMSAADYADYMDDIADQIAEKEQEAIEEQLEREEEARELAEEAAEKARELAEAVEEARIEAEEAAAEAAEEAAETYHDAIVEQIEKNLSLLESSKYTYDEMLDYIKYYYEQAIISAKEYYEYLEQMAESQVNKGQTQADRQWNYMSEYISRQIELEEEENDLLEAKADLLDAQNKKVKVYVEGQGFVYQQDMDAIKEAESSLKSTTSVWQELQNLMSEAETITNLKTSGILAGADLVSLVEGLNKNDSTSWANLISLLASNKASYDLASDLGITNPNQIRTSTTINGQTFNISNVSLPSVTDANSFVDGLTSLANQAIQSSSTRS